ncbi:carotenoid 1,2-hydratase [Actinoplanes sp. TBRC 11911]|uniref:hydroxyneurosporene dehydrogenase n=1 Tax=Actinoplanes sp. TBRC 11911 TaxID=2729386 RepID=UPI00145CD8F6|nr:hydroxyneurosporene dehydrogenase [Actinoplanes sp. TBRC 11911]NMO49912.1 carotenoid 1,2-hydratase [Actinoplanes sp. TBRC 11911]
MPAELSNDFARFDLDPHAVREWEDGARMSDDSGAYECWYFDAHLADGAKVVVVFMALAPQLWVNLELADGTRSGTAVTFPAAAWSAARGRTDVRLGPHRFAGKDLREYRIQATAGRVSVDFTLTANVPAWRPETGHVLFGEKRDLEFNWLAAVPRGTVRGHYVIDGARHETTGTGYHDHHWGNVSLKRVVNDWYRARGQAGPYAVVASVITSTEKHGRTELPLLMLAFQGRIIGGGTAKMTFERRYVFTDSKTGKPVANILRYTFVDGETRYVVMFERERDLTRTWLAKELPWPRRAASRLTGFDGAYLRFAGVLTVEHYESGRLIDKYTGDAGWDLTYLGHAPQGF